MLIRARPALAGLALTVAFLAPAPAALAQGRELSVERIFNSADFRLRGVPSVQWMRDGARFAFVDTDERGTTHVVVEDARTGQRTRLVDGARLVPAGRNTPLEIEDFTFSADERKLLVFSESQPVWRANTRGRFYVLDLASGRVTPVSSQPGLQQFAKFSPDGTRVGFVRDNDLWVADLASGRETRLTRDGSENVINGTFDWVYEEELDLRDGWRWSPDGQRIAFWRIDQTPVRTFYMVRESDSTYSRPLALRYPKPGSANPTARIGVADLGTGATTWMDTGADTDVYLARMEWAASPTEVMIQRMNRHQNRINVLLADARTGAARTVLSDTDPAWVEVDDDLTFLRGGREFLFSSERDGHNHLYLYDRSGRLVRQVTRGDWDVSSVYGVDERGGWIYFQAFEQGPREKHLYRVRLDGSGFQRLTREHGTHNILALGPGTPLFVASHSAAGVPTSYALHSADGRVVRVLEDNARVAATLRGLAIRQPEFFTVPGADGTPLNGTMVRPADFDPARKYPVLIYVYGGPGSQTVTDAWGSTRYLWHQMLAQKGYVVVSVDNRGTAGRGSAFKKSVYLNLGQNETADQVAAGRWLAQQPWVDASRIGIWGWSYGGYMTALTLMQPGHPFKAGIAVAPVADWELYDSIYTERFMRTPAENPTGYGRAPTSLAAQLKGDLLVIHGTGDDNVHFQNTVQLVDCLQAANKQFDLMIYPDRNHSIAGGRSTHLYTYMTNWLTENL